MKTFIFLALVIGASICSLRTHEDQVESILSSFENKPTKEFFKVYHSLFKKNYDLNTEEGLHRYRIFKENLQKVKSHNAKNTSSFKLGINQFSDLTADEKQKLLMDPSAFEECKFTNAFKTLEASSANASSDSTAATERKAYNYSSRFPPVKDQGNCGSCWAFSLTALLEASVFSKKNSIVNLSEQQMLDCSPVGDCRGGCIPKNIRMLQKTPLMPTSVYGDYVAKPNECKNDLISKNSSSGFKLRGYRECYFCEVNSMNKMLAYGPVLATVGVPESFFSFKSGIWNPTFEECNRNESHAVVIAGWGFDETTGVEYVLVRNSWGVTWGEKGYIRVAVPKEPKFSDCGLVNDGYQFTIDK